MVRMMALSEYKQFLSFADLARYINENENVHYDVFEYADRKRFIGLLLDLIRENKLKPFFSYDGMVQVEIISQDTASEKNITKYNTNFYGYALFPIGLYPKFFRLISENEATELKYSGEFYPYDFQTRTEYINLGERDYISYQISSEENFSLTIHDLYYLKSDLDHLFKKNSQVDNAETVRQLQAEIAELRQAKEDARQGYLDAHGDVVNKFNQEIMDLKKHLYQAELALSDIIKQRNEEKIQQPTNQPSDTPTNDDLLKAIFDNSKPNQYAPELHKAILIWQEIYMTDNISKYIDTHNGRYIEALKNLKINFTDNAPKERIRVITTPKKKKEQTKK